MGLKAITANRLRDGAVVWLGAQNDWVERIEAAATYDEAGAQAALGIAQEDERRNIVVAIYSFDVELVHGAPAPLRTKERIRALGPSVRADVGKQADRPARVAA